MWWTRSTYGASNEKTRPAKAALVFLCRKTVKIDEMNYGLLLCIFGSVGKPA